MILAIEQVKRWKFPNVMLFRSLGRSRCCLQVALPVSNPVGGSAPLRPLALAHVLSQKYAKPMEVENIQSSTGTREEPDGFVLGQLGLVPIVEANDIDLTRAPSRTFVRFVSKPAREGPELDALKAGICPRFSG